jgi:hypothetical protein
VPLPGPGRYPFHLIVSRGEVSPASDTEVVAPVGEPVEMVPVGEAFGEIVRQPDPPRAPLVIAGTPTATGDGRSLVASRQGHGILIATLVDPGAIVHWTLAWHGHDGDDPSTTRQSSGRTQADAMGRATVAVFPDRASIVDSLDRVELVAENRLHHSSVPTVVRLDELTAAPSPGLEFARTDVALDLSANTAERKVTLTLEPDDPHFIDFVAGRIDPDMLAEREGVPYVRLGRAAPSDQAACDPSRTLSRDPPVITFGERPTVVLVERLESPVGRSGDTLSLCVRDRHPALGNVGALTLRLRDFKADTFDPPPDESVTDGHNATYTWHQVEPHDRMLVHLTRSPLAIVSDLPRMTLQDLLPGEAGLAPMVALLGLALGLLPLVALGYAVGSGGMATASSVETRRAVLVAMLVITVAIGFQIATQTRLLNWLTARIIPYRLMQDVPRLVINDIPGVLLAAMGASLAMAGRRRSNSLLTVVGAIAVVAGATVVASETVATLSPSGDQSTAPLALQLNFGLAVGLLAFTTAVAWPTLSTIARDGFSRAAGPASVVLLASGILLVGLSIAVSLAPVGDALVRQVPVSGSLVLSPRVGENVVTLLVQPLGLVAALAAMMVALAVLGTRPWEALPGDARAERTFLLIGTAVFAGWIAGSARSLAGIPVGFVVGLLLFWAVLRPAGERRVLADLAPRVRAMRLELLRDRMKTADKPAKSDGDRDSGSEVSSVSGPDAQGAPAQAVSEHAPGGTAGVGTGTRAGVDGQALPDRPLLVEESLALGMSARQTDNVGLAIRLGIRVLVPLLALYVTLFWIGSTQETDPLLLPRLIVNLLIFAAWWILLSAFFGLYFEYLRGRSGMQKGMVLGGLIVLITLPLELAGGLVDPSRFPAIAIGAIQTFAFTALLGLQIDWRQLRPVMAASGFRDRLGTVAGASGQRSLATVAISIGVATLVGLQSIIQGELSQVLENVVAPFLPVPLN